MKAKSTNRKERACNFIKRQTKRVGLFMIMATLATSVVMAQKSTTSITDENSTGTLNENVLKNVGNTLPVRGFSTSSLSSALCPSIASLNMLDHTHRIANLSWDNTANFDSIKIRYAVTGTTNYRTIAISGTPNPGSIVIDGLLAVTTYDFEISTVCQNGSISNWSPVLQITTFPEPAPRFASNQRSTSFIKLNPNPATSYTILSFTAPVNSMNSIMISTTTGIVIKKTNVYCVDGKIQVPITLTNIPPGLYFVQVGNNLGMSVERLIVQ